MTKKLFFCSFLLVGCASSTTNIDTTSSKNYEPVDPKLLTNVEPYSSKPKPTLKDELKRKEREECYERNRKVNENQHIEPSFFQAVLDSISCG